ncbi:hypothetical protein D3C76_1582070 [compost metagenome]
MVNSTSRAGLSPKRVTIRFVPDWRPTMAASVTANSGGVSRMIRSYNALACSRNSLKFACISSSDGLGGI